MISQAALEVLEHCWETAGRPEDEKELLPVLKRVLDCCVRQGVTYPRIFLKRKGELTRGEFKLRKELTTSFTDPAAVRFTAGSHPKIPQAWIENGIEQSKKDFEAILLKQRVPRGSRGGSRGNWTDRSIAQ